MASTRTVLALGAHELGGEGGVYLKLMFSVQGPPGSMVSIRTVLALGALPARRLNPGAVPAPGPFVVDRFEP
jgi:hypothetical protein